MIGYKGFSNDDCSYEPGDIITLVGTDAAFFYTPSKLFIDVRDPSVIFKIEVLGDVHTQKKVNNYDFDRYYTNKYKILEKLDGEYNIDDIKYKFVNGLAHADGQPAIVYPGGEKWLRMGILHREGAPAVIFGDDFKQWFEEGYCLYEEIDGMRLLRTDRGMGFCAIPMRQRFI